MFYSWKGEVRGKKEMSTNISSKACERERGRRKE
jgi:hypothetical protein